MLSVSKMASKKVKNLNLDKAGFFLNPDWLDLVLAEFFLIPDWMNLVLADLFYIGHVFLVLAQALLARFKLYQIGQILI